MSVTDPAGRPERRSAAAIRSRTEARFEARGPRLSFTGTRQPTPRGGWVQADSEAPERSCEAPDECGPGGRRAAGRPPVAPARLVHHHRGRAGYRELAGDGRVDAGSERGAQLGARELRAGPGAGPDVAREAVAEADEQRDRPVRDPVGDGEADRRVEEL